MPETIHHIYKVYTTDWYLLGLHKTLEGAKKAGEEYWSERNLNGWVQDGFKWTLDDELAIIVRVELKE